MFYVDTLIDMLLGVGILVAMGYVFCKAFGVK